MGNRCDPGEFIIVPTPIELLSGPYVIIHIVTVRTCSMI